MTKEKIRFVIPIGNLSPQEAYRIEREFMDKFKKEVKIKDEIKDEIERCKNDIVYFAEKYFLVDGNGIKLRQHQKELLKNLNSGEHVSYVTARQTHGKLLERITKEHRNFKLTNTLQVTNLK